MGTQLMARGMPLEACGTLWNVERPEEVRAVHAAYRAAGCDLLTTNTFGGSAYALERYGLASRMEELNCAGLRIAREAAGPSAWVLGNVGPLGDFLSPRGPLSACERRACFRAQIAALKAGGVDAILIETMSDPVEMEIAVNAAKESADSPVFATYAFKKDKDEFRTLTGVPLAEAVQRALAAGADAVGANCGVALSLAENLELAKELVRAAGSTPVILQPNAGSPQWLENGAHYAATPEAMAGLARLLLEAGVRLIGGCCGSSPLHLAAMSRALH